MSEITITTRKSVIAAAPDRWEAQYADYTGSDVSGKTRITEALKALPAADVTKENVDLIIGNESWTRLVCDQCQQDSDVLANFDGCSEYPVSICLKCLKKANRLIRGES